MNAVKKNHILLYCLAAILALAGAGIPAFSAKAAEVYTVQVVPCYQHPVTGEEEDTGHNPGIGQAMVEAQVQSVGLVEIEDDGTIWLTSRWNMVDTQANVSFGIQTWGDSGWEPMNYEIVQQIQDEYVVTDFRIQLSTLDDIVRATNYVEPMGREVTFYYFLQNLSEGAGDFQTNVQSANVDTLVQTMQEAEAAESASAGTTSSGTAASTSAKTATTTTKKATSSDTSGDEGSSKKSISEKTAKTSSADDLLEEATGIDGEDAEVTETSLQVTGGSASPALLAAATAGGAAGGAIIGGGLIGCMLLHMMKKRKEREAVYDNAETKGEEKKQN